MNNDSSQTYQLHDFISHIHELSNLPNLYIRIISQGIKLFINVDHYARVNQNEQKQKPYLSLSFKNTSTR